MNLFAVLFMLVAQGAGPEAAPLAALEGVVIRPERPLATCEVGLTAANIHPAYSTSLAPTRHPSRQPWRLFLLALCATRGDTGARAPTWPPYTTSQISRPNRNLVACWT